jgi:hypothetical protein
VQCVSPHDRVRSLVLVFVRERARLDRLYSTLSRLRHHPFGYVYGDDASNMCCNRLGKCSRTCARRLLPVLEVPVPSAWSSATSWLQSVGHFLVVARYVGRARCSCPGVREFVKLPPRPVVSLASRNLRRHVRRGTFRTLPTPPCPPSAYRNRATLRRDVAGARHGIPTWSRADPSSHLTWPLLRIR